MTPANRGPAGAGDQFAELDQRVLLRPSTAIALDILANSADGATREMAAAMVERELVTLTLRAGSLADDNARLGLENGLLRDLAGPVTFEHRRHLASVELEKDQPEHQIEPPPAAQTRAIELTIAPETAELKTARTSTAVELDADSYGIGIEFG